MRSTETQTQTQTRLVATSSTGEDGARIFYPKYIEGQLYSNTGRGDAERANKKPIFEMTPDDWRASMTGNQPLTFRR
ncbi:MAG: hypothetical protein WCJ70_04750 [bacterium]